MEEPKGFGELFQEGDFVGRKKRYCGGLAMSQAVMGAAHFWREKRLLRPGVFLSDRVQGEIRKAGLRVPKPCRLKDV